MVLGPVALICAGSAIVFLIVSGWWTDRTYSRFEHIPGHYDFSGKATRLEPRRQMSWLLPVMFSLTLAFFVVLMELMPRETMNGDPSNGIILIAVVTVASQGLVLWLLARWARRQGG